MPISEKYDCGGLTSFLTSMQLDYSEFKTSSGNKEISLAIQQKKVIQGKIEHFKSPEIIFGTEYFGPKQVESALNMEIHPDDIPAVPFSWSELIEARKKGMFLILRVNRDKSGEDIHKYLEKPKGFGSWDEPALPPFESEVRTGWALVSENSFYVDKLSSTKNIYHLIENIEKYLPFDMKTNDSIERALESFRKTKERIDWHFKDVNNLTNGEIADKKAQMLYMIEDASIVKMLFHQPAEALYDAMVNPGFLGAYYHDSSRNSPIYEGDRHVGYKKGRDLYHSVLIPKYIKGKSYDDNHFVIFQRDTEWGETGVLSAGRDLIRNSRMCISWRGKE